MDLLNVSGYAQQRNDFDQLMNILDGELRLITPIDSGELSPTKQGNQDEKREYQLTHDFLVPYLRD